MKSGLLKVLFTLVPMLCASPTFAQSQVRLPTSQIAPLAARQQTTLTNPQTTPASPPVCHWCEEAVLEIEEHFSELPQASMLGGYHRAVSVPKFDTQGGGRELRQVRVRVLSETSGEMIASNQGKESTILSGHILSAASTTFSVADPRASIIKTVMSDQGDGYFYFELEPGDIETRTLSGSHVSELVLADPEVLQKFMGTGEVLGTYEAEGLYSVLVGYGLPRVPPLLLGGVVSVQYVFQRAAK